MSDLGKLIYEVERGSISTDHLIDAIEHPLDMLGFEAFDGDLNAAKALHEALLPGWEWRLVENRAWVWRTATNLTESGEVEDDAFKGLPARAWLIAILKAYRSQEAVQ